MSEKYIYEFEKTDTPGLWSAYSYTSEGESVIGSWEFSFDKKRF